MTDYIANCLTCAIFFCFEWYFLKRVRAHTCSGSFSSIFFRTLPLNMELITLTYRRIRKLKNLSLYTRTDWCLGQCNWISLSPKISPCLSSHTRVIMYSFRWRRIHILGISFMKKWARCEIRSPNFSKTPRHATHPFTALHALVFTFRLSASAFLYHNTHKRKIISVIQCK